MTIIYDGRIDLVGLGAEYIQDEYSSDNITLVDDPAGSGEQVAKCMLRATDDLVDSGYRAEIRSTGTDTGAQSWPGMYWYYFELYVPPEAVPPLGWKQTCWQFHGPGGESPMWFGEIMPDGAVHISRNVITGSGSYDPMKYRIAPEKALNRWLKFVVQADWKNASEGMVRIWLDGALIVEFYATSIYSTAGRLYWKSGLYANTTLNGWPITGADSWHVYSKGLIVGDSTYTTIDDFLSAAGVTLRSTGTSNPYFNRPPPAHITPNGDFALVSNSANYDLSSASGCTIMAVASYSTTEAYQVIISDNLTSFELAVRNQVPRRFRVQFKTNAPGDYMAYVNTSYGVIASGQSWFWIAVTCDFSTGEVRFYIDGKEQTVVYEQTQAAFTPAASGQPRIGARSSGAGLYWRGNLGGLRFYKRVLTPAEISSWYGTDSVSNTTNLVSWWKFNESSGNLIDYGSSPTNGVWQNSLRQYSPVASRSVVTRSVESRAVRSAVVAERRIA